MKWIKWFKCIPVWVLPLLLSVIILGGIVIIAVDAVPNYLRVAPEGVNIFQGLIPGMADSYEKGKEHGLSAEDTELVLAARLKENGKTEVLIADGDITDFQKYSSELFNINLDKYAALYEFQVNVVFTVDLSEATAEINDEGTVVIRVPQPSSEIIVDPGNVKTIAEDSNPLFDGSTSEGVKAYINSFNQLKKKAGEAQVELIPNYDTLLDRAKLSAEQIVTETVHGVYGSDKSVEGVFGEE